MKRLLLTILFSVFFCGQVFAAGNIISRFATDAETTAQTRDDVGLTPSNIPSITAVCDDCYPGLWGVPTEITIVSGIAILPGQGYYEIDTEGDTDSDNLTQITGLVNGDEIILKSANDARTVVVVEGAYLKLNNEANFTINSIYDRIRLQCIGSDICVELGNRSSGGS